MNPVYLVIPFLMPKKLIPSVFNLPVKGNLIIVLLFDKFQNLQREFWSPDKVSPFTILFLKFSNRKAVVSLYLRKRLYAIVCFSLINFFWTRAARKDLFILVLP